MATPTKAELVLRGSMKSGEGSAPTETVALWRHGDNAYLTGRMLLDGRSQQVLVHLNQGKPAAESGEVGANYLVVTRRKVESADYETIGFGHAMNARKDKKPVYMDTVLFNLGGEKCAPDVVPQVVAGTTPKSLDPATHQKLGFGAAQIPRPTASASMADRDKQHERMSGHEGGYVMSAPAQIENGESRPQMFVISAQPAEPGKIYDGPIVAASKNKVVQAVTIDNLRTYIEHDRKSLLGVNGNELGERTRGNFSIDYSQGAHAQVTMQHADALLPASALAPSDSDYQRSGSRFDAPAAP